MISKFLLQFFVIAEFLYLCHPEKRDSSLLLKKERLLKVVKSCRQSLYIRPL